MTTGYPEQAWRRFTEPRHAGALGEAATGRAQSPGGELVLELDVRVAAQTVVEAAFRAYGCPATVAAADWLCERIGNEDVAAAGAVEPQAIEAALELAPEQRVCCLVAVDALGAALAKSVTVDTPTDEAELKP